MNVHVLWVADHTAFTTHYHTHDFFQIAFCKKKGGTITIGDVTYVAKPDHVYLMKPTVMHTMTRGDDMKLIEIKFMAEGEELISQLNALPNEFCLSDVAFMKNILRQTVKEGLLKAPYSEQTTNASFKIFLAHAIREFDYNYLSEKPENDSSVISTGLDYTKNNDIIILNLKDYINENLHREITLKELADTVYFNPTYFVRRFKILWGVSPMKFVLNARINKAKELMLSTTLSVSEIAEKCGFNSIHYFSRTFKNYEGISPSEYIDENKKLNAN